MPFEGISPLLPVDLKPQGDLIDSYMKTHRDPDDVVKEAVLQVLKDTSIPVGAKAMCLIESWLQLVGMSIIKIEKWFLSGANGTSPTEERLNELLTYQKKQMEREAFLDYMAGNLERMQERDVQMLERMFGSVEEHKCDECRKADNCNLQAIFTEIKKSSDSRLMQASG